MHTATAYDRFQQPGYSRGLRVNNFSLDWTAQFYSGKTFIAEVDVTYWLVVDCSDPIELSLEQVEVGNALITEKSDPVMWALFKADVERNHVRFVEILGERQ